MFNNVIPHSKRFFCCFAILFLKSIQIERVCCCSKIDSENSFHWIVASGKANKLLHNNPHHRQPWKRIKFDEIVQNRRQCSKQNYSIWLPTTIQRELIYSHKQINFKVINFANWVIKRFSYASVSIKESSEWKCLRKVEEVSVIQTQEVSHNINTRLSWNFEHEPNFSHHKRTF